MRGAVRVRPVARLRGLHPRSVSRAAFIPATSPLPLRLVSPIRLSRNVPAPRAVHALLGFPSEPFKTTLPPPRHQPPPR